MAPPHGENSGVFTGFTRTGYGTDGDAQGGGIRLRAATLTSRQTGGWLQHNTYKVYGDRGPGGLGPPYHRRAAASGTVRPKPRLYL